MRSKTELINDLIYYHEYVRRSCQNSLYFTLKFFWETIIQDKYIDNWHIPYLCKELEYIGKLAIERKPKEYDLLINIPPGTSKSTIVTIMWDVHNWIQDPTIISINSSYSSGLSVDHQIKFSSIVHSDLFQEIFQPYFKDKFGSHLEFTKDTESIITNNFGGSRIATSTGGTVTGKHAHIIKRDDPLDPEQAESKAYRDRANRFNDRTLSTRKKDKDCTVTVTVMQRLHESDTSGNELSKEDKKLKHICLPAELSDLVKPKELVDNYTDRLLDINRLSLETLKNVKIDIGSYGYAGQFMQNPTPEGGGKIKKEWFTFIEKSQLPVGINDLFIDGAYTEFSKNDPSGFMVTMFYRETLYILHATSKWLELPGALNFIPLYISDFHFDNLSRVMIEPKASGKSTKQMLKHTTKLNAIEIKSRLVSEGKEARAQVAGVKLEAGRVILVKGNWNDDFIEQLIGFPNKEHDEYIDLLGYACDYYFNKRKVIH